jgi:hypothetical protein
MDRRRRLPQGGVPAIPPAGQQPVAPAPAQPSPWDVPFDDITDDDEDIYRLSGSAVAPIRYHNLLLTMDVVQEGGAPLINFLLARAIHPDNEVDKSLPRLRTDVRDWHFRDILKLPRVQKEEWKTACHKELESLRRCNIFELTDLPTGRKVVKNHWVFDIKSNGRKKA